MKFAYAALALAAGVSAWSNATIVYETVTTDVYTTYCPYATTLTYEGKTYTVTEATTLTITDVRIPSFSTEIRTSLTRKAVPMHSHQASCCQARFLHRSLHQLP